MIRSKQWMMALVLSIFLAILPTTTNAQGTIEDELPRIRQATVFIYQVQDTSDNFFTTCVGSGTLVSRNGLILTNAHTTDMSESCPGNTLIIALTTSEDDPPVPLYRAEILQSAPGLDLALIRIHQDLDGRRINPDELSLPFVELTDSSQVRLDQTITVVGYTSLDNTPVQTLRGTVTGFTEEPTGPKSWLKTNVSIPGLMTGSGAYNGQGQLIGVPTTSPPDVETGSASCQLIQDTNNDRQINDNDICIPIGGFINALRASNFATPLIQSASLDLQVNLQSQGIPQSTLPTEEPVISRLFFASSVNNAGLPTNIVGNLPTGATSLYLFFDYANMTPETIYELRVTVDNIPSATYSLAPVRWSGGESGLWFIGNSDQAWPNGTYTFTVFIDGMAENTASIVVGGVPTTDPNVGDIVFGLSDFDGTPLGNGFVLPTGNVASARFIYRNMNENIEITERWFYENAEVYRNTNLWNVGAFGADGARTISIQDANGLLPGRYRLEIYLDGRLGATSDFTIAGVPRGAFPEVFPDIHFTSANNAIEAATTPAANSFPTETERVFVVFNWQQIQPGTRWTVRWTVDNNTFYEQSQRWSVATDGSNYVITLDHNNFLPDGTYRVELLIGEVLLASDEATIGIGQLRIDRFAQASGLQLQGQIMDVDAGTGIPGVTFVLISEDFSVADFVWDSEQIYALATTDRNGFFQMERLLEISTETRSVPYSVVISADGYLPIEADGFVVDGDTENPLNLTIYLTKE